jgi:uncharacterized membrane protein YfcA
LPAGVRAVIVGRMDLSLSTVLVIAASFLLAGLVKGVIGLGLPTVSMGLLALVATPAQAAALLVVPSLVTNVWQMAAGPSLKPLLLRLGPMMLAILAGTWLGTLWLTLSQTATTGLGIALIVYGIVGLLPLRLAVPGRAEPWLSPMIGAVTGAITAATGVFVIPAVPYLQALGLHRDDLVQALGLSFTVSTIGLAFTLAGEGAFSAGIATGAVAALAPALAGMLLGQWIRMRIDPGVFRLCFFVGLLILGAHLALRPLL